MKRERGRLCGGPVVGSVRGARRRAPLETAGRPSWPSGRVVFFGHAERRGKLVTEPRQSGVRSSVSRQMSRQSVLVRSIERCDCVMSSSAVRAVERSCELVAVRVFPSVTRPLCHTLTAYLISWMNSPLTWVSRRFAVVPCPIEASLKRAPLFRAALECRACDSLVA